MLADPTCATTTAPSSRAPIAQYVLAVLACTLVSALHAQTIESRTVATIESGVDASILPGDDFFAFANGAWLKATDFPPGKERITAGSEIAELTRQQVAKLIEDAGNAPAGSSARKVADFRAAYLDVAAIEVAGFTPLKPMLERIDRVNNKLALTRLLGSELRADVDPLDSGIYNSSHLLGLAVQPSIHGEKTYLAFLLQGGLGLPDREYYIGTEARFQSIRTRYLAYIERMLSLSGLSGVKNLSDRARAVMELETVIARSHATQEASGNDRNADTVWTRADFNREAPGMNWSAFLAAAGLGGQQTFVAWQPGALRGAAALLASASLQTWKDYLRLRVMDRYAEVLPRSAADEASALRAAASGKPAGTREQRAIDATQAAMGNALGRIYVERYFPAGHKARVQTIVANVVTAFSQRLDTVTWLSPGSKAMAQAKLKTLYFGAGYPDEWHDLSTLAISATDAAGNLRRVSDHNYRRAIARLGKRVDQREWYVAPQWPGAVLAFHRNSYNFSAALLQAPKFDATASDAMNYGAIGAIVGHEVSHFVDTLGADYESDGHMRRWWSAEDLSRYQTVTQALVAQFASYQPFADLPVDGKLTLVENLADLGGLVAAFDAYRHTLGDRVNDKAYVRQQDRQFFIGFARSWRGKMSEAALRKYLAADNHAPENFRTSTVRNLDAWYEAFDVQPGQKLYLDPGSRVRIW